MSSAPIVTITEGKLRGKLGKDIKGNTFHCYEGIPFAQAPVGNLRFKAPKPALPWDGIKDATKHGPQNYALNMNLELIKELLAGKISEEAIKERVTFAGSEDCLTLNVYTPNASNILDIKPKPVMVWVHGGAYIMGSAEPYGPDILISEDIVLVTVNYRLGALGFLVVEDPALDVPGNAALKDIILALQWVQNNIKHFNGDPNNVTIFGESAGGSASHYLLVSPLSKGLFHRVIAQSGSAFNCWARGRTDNAKSLAKILGCTATSDKEILEFLQELPVEKVYQGQLMLQDIFDASELRHFCPVVEKPSPNACIPDEPINLLNSGNFIHVPLITGLTSMEGLLFCGDIELSPSKLFDESMVPWKLGYKKGTKEYDSVVQEIREFYFGDQKEHSKKSLEAAQLSTDNFFFIEIIAHTLAHAENSKQPVYFYVFSVDSKLSMFGQDERGVCHANDLGYLFYPLGQVPDIKPDSLEDLTVQRMAKLWTNFAKNGNPNPSKKDDLIPVEWKPVKTYSFSYLDIGKELEIKKGLNKERVDFWKKIYKESPSGKIYFK